ncbi:toll/interleukin-1 receptor domain-containing protein [Streptomyces sp. NPDC058989]|uniref:toll/interleukin-1 receptor domain-containing protein n=1 Tax=Streptomyces sp. NPDC058989 TaxID=3346686 RepID=UPI00369CDE28
MGDGNAAERPYRNDAFISYHHASDSAKAAHLRRGLQNFARSWRQLRALRVFLDKASLSANPGLWPEIERQLADSGAFILLACPGSADSVWVQKEAEWWRTGLGPRKMLIAVTGGELVWDHERADFDWERTTCLPRTMAGMFTDEPRWVDLRWMSEEDPGSLRDPRFQQCVADLAAPLHGRPKEDLIGADVAQHRKTRRLARGALAVITTLAVLAGAASVVAVLQRDEARRQARLATSRQLAATALNLKDGNLRLASLLGIEAYRMQKSPEAIAALNRLATDSPYLVRMVSSPKDVSAVGFSGDDGAVAVGDEGGAVTVWSSDGGTVRARTKLPGRITAAGFSADGKRLAVGDGKGNLGVYDLAGRKLRRLAPMPKAVSSLQFGMGGNLAVADEDGTVTLYEQAREKIRSKRTGHLGSLVVFQNEESHLLVRDAVGGGALYTVPDLRAVLDSRETTLPAGQATVGVSPGGHCFGYLKYGFFTSTGLPKAKGHETLAETCGDFPVLPDEEALMVALTDTGRMAVGTASGITVVDGEIHSENGPSGGQPNQLRNLTGTGSPTLLGFSATGERLASAHGRTVALWDLGQPSRTAHRHGVSLTDDQTMVVAPPLATGPDSKIAWSNPLETESPSDPETPLHVWSPKGGTIAGGDDAGYYSVAFGSDGRTLYAGHTGEVQEWRIVGKHLEKRRTIDLSGTQASYEDGYPAVPLEIAPLEAGSVVVTTGDGAVHVADRSARRTRVVVPPGTGDSQQLLLSSLSTDGRIAAVENTKGAVDLYDVLSGRKVQTARLKGEAVGNFALSAEGRSLFLEGTRHTFARWDLDERRLRWQSDEPSSARVAASADGRTVVTLTDSGILTRWDVETGDRLGGPKVPIPPRTMSGNRGIGQHTGFVVDRAGTLWTATEGGELLSWDFSVDSWITSLCRIAGRSLTDAEWRRYVGTTPPSQPTCG